MKKTIIYVVRHGQAKGNKEDLLLGQFDVPLTEKGKMQALKSSDFFKNKDINFIYSSDLKRAFETAEVIAEKIGKKVIKDKLLRERDIDVFENLTLKEAKEKVAKNSPFFTLSDKEKLTYKFTPNMESAFETEERFRKFCHLTAKKHPGKNIVAVTHGGLMLYFLISLGLEKYRNLFGDPNPFENLGFFKLMTDGKNFEIMEFKGYNP